MGIFNWKICDGLIWSNQEDTLASVGKARVLESGRDRVEGRGQGRSQLGFYRQDFLSLQHHSAYHQCHHVLVTSCRDRIILPAFSCIHLSVARLMSRTRFGFTHTLHDFLLEVA
jgi:hypothetical protein